MATWNKAEPSGLERVSNGATRIREAKSALQSAMQVEHSFPGGLHSFPYGNSITAYEGRWRYNNVLGVIESVISGVWVAITETVAIPSGSKTLFYQASAPTGWTQDTTFGNDVMLRILGTGNIGSGGSWHPNTDTSSTHNHTGVTSTDVVQLAHTSSVKVNPSGGAYPPAVTYAQAPANHSRSHHHAMSLSGDHYHTVDSTWRPLYIDVIVATKD